MLQIALLPGSSVLQKSFKLAYNVANVRAVIVFHAALNEEVADAKRREERYQHSAGILRRTTFAKQEEEISRGGTARERESTDSSEQGTESTENSP